MFSCLYVCTMGEVKGHCQGLSTFVTGSFTEPGFNLLIQLQISCFCLHSAGTVSVGHYVFYTGAGDQTPVLMLDK